MKIQGSVRSAALNGMNLTNTHLVFNTANTLINAERSSKNVNDNNFTSLAQRVLLRI
jgi:hypothetical protein